MTAGIGRIKSWGSSDIAYPARREMHDAWEQHDDHYAIQEILLKLAAPHCHLQILAANLTQTHR